MAIPALRETLDHMDVSAADLSDPAQAARASIEAALDYCAQKMHLPGPQSVVDQLRNGDEAAHGYFQYALSGCITEYLAGYDAEIKAAYLYYDEATADDLVFGETPLVSPLHLILVVNRKTEALYSLIAALDRALANSYAERAGLRQAAHLLDAQVVDETEVRRGTGYAVLLNSLHHRPVLVWQN